MERVKGLLKSTNLNNFKKVFVSNKTNLTELNLNKKFSVSFLGYLF